MKPFPVAFCSLLLLTTMVERLPAQSITAASDGTGTAIGTAVSGQYDISGGTQAGDNVFHSFDQFGLNAGEIANFIANPSTANILGRVTGGDPSIINGLVQVTGSNANLFLMNPVGIVFGQNAQINVAGDFTATTATGIQLDEQWFNAIGSNDYASLTGDPSGFAFATADPTAIINGGALEAQSVVLLGGSVVNTGTIAAAGGDITIESVPGDSLVTVTQDGHLLSLGLPTEARALSQADVPLTPLDLPQLLSNSQAVAVATGLVVEGDRVRLTRTDTAIPTGAGSTIASGTLDVSNSDIGAVGGRVDVLGEQVVLSGATIDVSGHSGGGEVRVGGGFQGNDVVQNAASAYVGLDVAIAADAMVAGDGGEVIVWADGATQYYGDISAEGGSVSGNGGFVEVSGAQSLGVDGTVSTLAPNGETGTLLLDPLDIVVSNVGTLVNLPPDAPTVNRGADPADGTLRIARDSIDNARSNVVLSATQDITFDAEIEIKENGVGLTVDAGRDITINENITTTNGNVSFIAGGSFVMDPDNAVPTLGTGNTNVRVISTGNGNVSIRAASIVLGGVSTSPSEPLVVDPITGEPESSTVGNISLTALSGDIFVRYIESIADDDGNAYRGGNISVLAAEGIFRATGVLSPGGGDGALVSVLSSGSLGSSAGGGFQNDDAPNLGGDISIISRSSNNIFRIGVEIDTDDDPRQDEAGDGDAVIGGAELDLRDVSNFIFEDERESGSRGAILSRNFNGTSDSGAYSGNSDGEGNVKVAVSDLPPPPPEFNDDSPSTDEVEEDNSGQCQIESEEENSCQTFENSSDGLLDVSAVMSE